MTAPRRILILAPHPDDEVVACGIAALRARAAGSDVFVLYLTTGVPAREASWPWQRPRHAGWVARRRREAETAAARLGLELLGFCARPCRRLRHDLDMAAAEIAAAIAACDAAALWVPAFEGGHQDHDAANALAAGFRDRLPVYEFAAYNFSGGRVRANRFPSDTGGETTLVGSPAEIAMKRRALACYKSERGNLRHVGVDLETCRPLPTHDYGKAPHAGRLFRERFHWVPFRHPRVDFDKSADVYRDLGIWTASRNLV